MKGIINHLKFSLKFINGYRNWLFFDIVIKIINLGIMLLNPLAYARFIASIADKNKITAICTLAFIVFLQLSTIILSYVLSKIENRLIKSISLKIQKDIFTKILNIPPGELTNYDEGSIYNMVVRDSAMPISYVFTILNELFSVFTLIGIGIMVLILSWELSLIIILTYPLIYIINVVFGKKLRFKQSEWMQSSDKFIGFLQRIINSFNFIKENFGLNKTVLAFNNYSDIVKQNSSDLEILKIKNDVYLNIIGLISYVLVNLLGIVLVVGEKILFSGFVAFNNYSTKFSSALDNVVSLNAYLQPTFVVLQRIEDIYSIYEKTILKANKQYDIDKNNFDIRIQHLGISLSTKEILKDININIKMGEAIKLNGKNGSGKTTILKILMKEYLDYDGEILIGNLNLKDIKYESLLQSVTFLKQNPPMLPLTIYDNITLFNHTDSINENQVINACKIVKLWDDIKDLPKGIYTEISEQFNLSAGQIQKIQFARALLKNTDVLLIDEITANLDADSVEIVLEMCNKFKLDGKTIIYISHTDNGTGFIDKHYCIDNNT